MYIVRINGGNYGADGYFTVVSALQRKGWEPNPPGLREFVLVTPSKKYHGVLFFTSASEDFKDIEELPSSE